MQSLLASMWTDWKDALPAWKTGEARAAPLSTNERLKPEEWRLTDQGALALTDLEAGGAQSVVDFVLRRGFFDGERRLILEPGRERVSRRESVRGAGRLVTMRKVQADAVFPAAVNVENWKEGADAFAAAFQRRVEAKGTQEDKGATADSRAQKGRSDSAPRETDGVDEQGSRVRAFKPVRSTKRKSP